MRGPTIDERLRDQNDLEGWIDCEARGGRHRLVLDQYVVPKEGPVAEYHRCRRCPVVIRRLQP